MALLGADSANVFDLLFDVANAAINFAAIGFELGFTRTSCADSATELRHFGAASGEARQQVIQLSELDLQLAFAGAGMGGKDI